ncbi:ribonuclease P protein component [uncultured Sulfitobacter sp.]|uniref:ribonuclease P protein component n=1 Tax=uncultured Sulfitobacter sp. TaxID=191468 RepID=UPI0026158A95|nr:ribonuclease P protein component [uncultured Sulfitobacter sp.]
MAPPETDLIGTRAVGDNAPAVLSCSALTTLTKRREFQRASRGKRVAMPGFILQTVRRPAGEANGIRIGYTCSKKVGNAVARNRAKRRLREIARHILPGAGRDGHDYVLVGRRETTAALPFSLMQADLAKALGILHGKRS